MPQTLLIDNFSDLNVLRSDVLDADTPAVGSNVNATVIDSDDYAPGDIVAVGQPGQSGCQITTVVDVVDDTTIMLANLEIIHFRSEPITKIFGSQIKVYRAANGTGLAPDDTSFALILGPFAITEDDGGTTATDPTGGSGFWYKFTYYNPTTAAETALSDSNAVRGGGYGHYCTVDAIRTEAGFKSNPYITDAMIATRRRDAEDEINGELVGMYTIPFVDPIPASITNATRLLAAGWLLAAEYGPVSSGTNKDAKDKIAQGRDIIARIKRREITLTDAAGQPTTTSSGVEGWPNATTATAPLSQGGDGGRKFRMGMDF